MALLGDRANRLQNVAMLQMLQMQQTVAIDLLCNNDVSACISNPIPLTPIIGPMMPLKHSQCLCLLGLVLCVVAMAMAAKQSDGEEQYTEASTQYRRDPGRAPRFYQMLATARDP